MHQRFWDVGFMPTHGFGWIMMILFWIIVLMLVVYLLRAIFDRKGSDHKDKDALTLLNERYARGELDKATYDRMKHDIQN